MWNKEFELPVQNRFDFLSERGTGGSHPVQSKNTDKVHVSRQNFAQSSLDDKMLHIFDELRFVRDEQVNCSRGLIYMHQTVSAVSEIENVIYVVLWKMNTMFYLSAVYIPTLDVNTFHVISGLDLICKNFRAYRHKGIYVCKAFELRVNHNNRY